MYVDYRVINLIDNDKREVFHSSKQREIVLNTTKGQVTYFNKGTILAIVLCDGEKVSLIAPADGYYSYIPDRFLYNLDTICCAYVNDESSAAFYGLKTEWTIVADPFTELKSIKWRSVWSYSSGGYYMSSVVINLNIKDNIPTALFSWDRQIKAKKGDTIVLLFTNGEEKKTIEIPIKAKGIASLPLNEDDLGLLMNYDFKGIRFKLNDGTNIDRYNFDRGDKLRDNPYYRFSCYAKCYFDVLIGIGDLLKQKRNQINKKEDIESLPKEPCYVYLMKDLANGFHKIGISNNPEYRESTLQSEKPTIELVCAKKYPSRLIAESIEYALHKAFGEKRLRGEWFELTPSDVNDIIQTLK